MSNLKSENLKRDKTKKLIIDFINYMIEDYQTNKYNDDKKIFEFSKEHLTDWLDDSKMKYDSYWVMDDETIEEVLKNQKIKYKRQYDMWYCDYSTEFGQSNLFQ